MSHSDQPPDRRARGATLRVPFVARCSLRHEDGREELALTANINEAGAYIAADALPRLGERLDCRFDVPGNRGELQAVGRVAWVNARVPRASGALPIGFGLQFESLTEPQREALERVVQAYLSDASG